MVHPSKVSKASSVTITQVLTGPIQRLNWGAKIRHFNDNETKLIPLDHILIKINPSGRRLVVR